MGCRTLERDSALRNPFLCTNHITAFLCDLYIPHTMLLRYNQSYDVLQNVRTGLCVTKPIPGHRAYYRLYDLYIPYTKFLRNNQSYDVLQNVRTGLCDTKPIPRHK
jgi:chemotaxis methyl-accepting protein methylase